VVQDSPLAKCQKRLVPEYGQLLRVTGALGFVCVREADEVEDEGVYNLSTQYEQLSIAFETRGSANLVWQRVLLVNQHTDEQRVRA
jgi:hypothetical protein